MLRIFAVASLVLSLVACSNDASLASTPCPTPSEGPNTGILFSDLPMGACAGAPTCRYGVAPCGTNLDNEVDGYQCTCVGGAWSCGCTSMGAGACAFKPDANTTCAE